MSTEPFVVHDLAVIVLTEVFRGALACSSYQTALSQNVIRSRTKTLGEYSTGTSQTQFQCTSQSDDTEQGLAVACRKMRRRMLGLLAIAKGSGMQEGNILRGGERYVEMHNKVAYLVECRRRGADVEEVEERK